MKRTILLTTAALSLAAGPALAQQDEPINKNEPSAADVAKTPVTDLNIVKQKIPDLLITAQRQPYDLRGLGRCRALIGEVEQLDAMLGPDFDLPQETRERITAARAGKVAVGSFIPFRGVIREVSGANEHDRKVRVAIQAGMARRGFLKAIGETRGCKYPGRPATREDVRHWMAQQMAKEQARQEAKSSAKDKQH